MGREAVGVLGGGGMGVGVWRMQTEFVGRLGLELDL